MLNLAGNPEDRFSRVTAHMACVVVFDDTSVPLGTSDFPNRSFQIELT